jgi:hypothetical protein
LCCLSVSNGIHIVGSPMFEIASHSQFPFH